jgi:hypothetical protein
MKVPPDLPLDEDQTITCGTCHNPHGLYEADKPYVAEALTNRVLSILTRKERYRTFFLRKPNNDGQLCGDCHEKGKIGSAEFHVKEASILEQYVGSARCGGCHTAQYAQWKLTPHAKMVRDPKKNPEALLGDFTKDPPFKKEEIVYVLGSRWTQRYVVKKNAKYLVKAPIWSIPGKSWDKSYWMDKPWDQFCQGCHTTGFEMKGEPRFVELGIGCEACHGPGRSHADAKGMRPIINPARLDSDRREMICESCHTAGHDRTGQFRFPMGYLPGKDLSYYYKGLIPKPGQDNETFQGDESYTDRRRQWVYWIDTFMNPRGLSCDICKNFRERKTSAGIQKMSVSDHCLTCHGGTWPKTSLHTKHLDKDVQCDSCHIPAIAPGGDKYSVHDHKFYFGKPAAKESVPVTRTCVGCHPDRKNG